MPTVFIDGNKQSPNDSAYLLTHFGGQTVGFRKFVDFPEVARPWGYTELSEYELKELTDTECKLAYIGRRLDGPLNFRRNDDGTFTYFADAAFGMPHQLYTVYTSGPRIPNPHKEHMTHAEFVAWYQQLARDGYTARIENFQNQLIRLTATNVSIQ